MMTGALNCFTAYDVRGRVPADLDTDIGGTFNKVFEIPAEFADYDQLVIRLTQPKKGIFVERVFNNFTFYSK